MVCSKTYRKVFRSVTRRHPSYGLKRRQRIAKAAVYAHKKHKRK